MSRTILSPNEFLLNDTTNFKGNQTLTIINRHKFPVTYTFTSEAAETRLTYDNVRKLNHQRSIIIVTDNFERKDYFNSPFPLSTSYGSTSSNGKILN